MADDTISPHKNARNNLSAEYVRDILDYNPETGIFMWRKTLSKRAVKGRKAGFINGHANGARIKIGILGREYMAHRIAWLFVTGEWPVCEIDHVDTNAMNNSWTNLRQASSSENLRNRGPQKNNTSGYKGVTFVESRGLWIAGIKVHGKRHNLGAFKSAADAYKAYCDAVQKMHGEFGRVF